LSHFIIIFLLGEKWEPSVIFFQILIFSAITSPQIGMMGKAVLAKGYSKLKFKIGLIQRLLKLTPIALGLFYGLMAFTWGMVLASLLVILMFFIVFHIKLKVNFWTQIKNFLLPNIIFIIFMILHLFYKDHINQWLFVFLFLVSHIVFVMLIKHESYVFIKNLILRIIKKRKNK
jgi:O-antigen/teichoic acid export membrane protein